MRAVYPGRCTALNFLREFATLCCAYV